MPNQMIELLSPFDKEPEKWPILSVIGLGKLGAPMAAVFANAGYQVIGYDVNCAIVEKLQAGHAPCEETDLELFIRNAGSRLSATENLAKAIAGSDISFVIVPTPSLENGFFDNRYLVASLDAIGSEIAKKDSYHLVVITSTVVPGSMGGLLTETLERAAGRKVGGDLGFCYSPEFIALGSVIRDMLNPDIVLIGQSDAKSGITLEDVYRNTCQNEPKYHRVNFANAELAKIAINTFVTTKISYANMLSAMCDKVPGADIDVLSETLGSDTRIGRKYLNGGAAYGGPCFPRDNKMLTAFARELGVPANIAEATDKINSFQKQRLLACLKGVAREPIAACVLGLTYKSKTAVTEESAGMQLVAALVAAGHTVVAHDPGIIGEEELPVGAALWGSLEKAIANAGVIFVMTAWPEYMALPLLLKERVEHLLLVDPWRMFVADDFPAAVTYQALGRGQPEKSFS